MTSQSPGILLLCRGLPQLPPLPQNRTTDLSNELRAFLLSRIRATNGASEASVYLPITTTSSSSGGGGGGGEGVSLGVAIVRVATAQQAQEVIDLHSATLVDVRHRMFIDRVDGSQRYRELEAVGSIDQGVVDGLEVLDFGTGGYGYYGD